MSIDFIQESTLQSLCGRKIVLEGVRSVDVSERSNSQINASVNKDTFLLIILVNSHCISLVSYFVGEKILSYQRHFCLEEWGRKDKGK